MVVTYQRGRGQGGSLVDPSENAWTQSLYDQNVGVGRTPDEREQVANALGFQTLFASVNTDGIWQLLLNAPVIYAGHWPGRTFGHWVVMVGISGKTLAINNPATSMETYDYNDFVGNVLQQSGDRPLIFP
jgi:ABC-type bacteriocin/lantibiotic exporter with double-glycine peptidase domain